MTEEQWNRAPLHELLIEQNERTQRLFIIGCCSPLLEYMKQYPKCVHAIKTTELFADNATSRKRLKRARHVVDDSAENFSRSNGNYSRSAQLHRIVANIASLDYSVSWVTVIVDRISNACQAFSVPSLDCCDVLRNVCNPYHSFKFKPNKQTLIMANEIYEDKTFKFLPVLADSLEDDGCCDTIVLNHLRKQGPHYRGWWSLDMVRKG